MLRTDGPRERRQEKLDLDFIRKLQGRRTFDLTKSLWFLGHLKRASHPRLPSRLSSFDARSFS
jgi:hypothetical protein